MGFYNLCEGGGHVNVCCGCSDFQLREDNCIENGAALCFVIVFLFHVECVLCVWCKSCAVRKTQEIDFTLSKFVFSIRTV